MNSQDSQPVVEGAMGYGKTFCALTRQHVTVIECSMANG